MEAAVAPSPALPPPSAAAVAPSPALPPPSAAAAPASEQVRVRRRALEAVLENCKRALELLESPDLGSDSLARCADPPIPACEQEEGPLLLPQSVTDPETDLLCSLVKSKVESQNFLEKLGSIQTSIYQNKHDDNASWNMITAKDLWEENHIDGENGPVLDDYVVVSQEDIVDSIACFMAAYLLSLKQTKELTPNQLQEALCKAFSVKKKKSGLRKAWEGSQVIYNVASWSATAIGIYQNPAILKAASVAFWSSFRVISKLF